MHGRQVLDLQVHALPELNHLAVVHRAVDGGAVRSDRHVVVAENRCGAARERARRTLCAVVRVARDSLLRRHLRTHELQAVELRRDLERGVLVARLRVHVRHIATHVFCDQPLHVRHGHDVAVVHFATEAADLELREPSARQHLVVHVLQVIWLDHARGPQRFFVLPEPRRHEHRGDRVRLFREAVRPRPQSRQSRRRKPPDLVRAPVWHGQLLVLALRNLAQHDLVGAWRGAARFCSSQAALAPLVLVASGQPAEPRRALAVVASGMRWPVIDFGPPERHPRDRPLRDVLLRARSPGPAPPAGSAHSAVQRTRCWTRRFRGDTTASWTINWPGL